MSKTHKNGEFCYFLFLHTKIFNSKNKRILTYEDLYRNMKFCLEFNADFKYFYQNVLSISVRDLYDFLPTDIVKFSKKIIFYKKLKKKFEK